MATLTSFQSPSPSSPVQDFYDRCMKGSIRGLIKGGLVYQYVMNPFFVWCERFAPQEEKDKESPYMNVIFEKGRIHEDEVVKQFYPGALEIDPTKHEEAFRQTIDAMFRGEQYISNGILYYLPDRYVAVPDVLVKTPGESVFGDWYYQVVEIKSSNQIREEHIMQAAYYTKLVGFLQGKTPETLTMIGGHREKEEYPFADLLPRVNDVLGGIRSIFDGLPVQPTKCGWPWESFSIRKLKEQKSVALIPNLFSSHKEILEQAGVRTLEDFFTLNVLQVKGIHFDTLDRYRRHAKALLQGRHQFLEKPFLPEGKTEVFVDLEGIEPMELEGKKVGGDYLIGTLTRENGTEEYRDFTAEPGQEHRMLVDFLKFLRGKDAVLYHYGHYEKTHLARLAQNTHVDAPVVQELMKQMVDLLPLTRKSVIFPTTSYTLKDIGRYLGYQWQGISDAKDSIVLYVDFLKTGNRASLEKIIQYNRDDCVALRHLKDFLVWGV